MLFYTIYLLLSYWFMQKVETLDKIERLTAFALISILI